MFKVYKETYGGLYMIVEIFKTLDEAKKFVESYKDTKFYEALTIEEEI